MVGCCSSVFNCSNEYKVTQCDIKWVTNWKSFKINDLYFTNWKSLKIHRQPIVAKPLLRPNNVAAIIKPPERTQHLYTHHHQHLAARQHQKYYIHIYIWHRLVFEIWHHQNCTHGFCFTDLLFLAQTPKMWAVKSQTMSNYRSIIRIYLNHLIWLRLVFKARANANVNCQT